MNSLSEGCNDFVTFMLKQVSVNYPNIKIFQFEILGQFFGIGLLCHKNEDRSNRSEFYEFGNQPLPFETSSSHYFDNLVNIFRGFSNGSLDNFDRICKDVGSLFFGFELGAYFLYQLTSQDISCQPFDFLFERCTE